jgi:hypothetical protein
VVDDLDHWRASKKADDAPIHIAVEATPGMDWGACAALDDRPREHGVGEEAKAKVDDASDRQRQCAPYLELKVMYHVESATEQSSAAELA